MDDSKRLILLVEDDEDDVILLQRALADVHVTNPTHVVADGEEAIRYLSGEGPFANRDKFPLPALVLLDLKLPRRPGVEVLRWIKRRKTNVIPVIVFTSSSNVGDVKAAYEAGAASYVVKPLNVDGRRKFANLLKEYWLGLNQTAL